MLVAELASLIHIDDHGDGGRGCGPESRALRCSTGQLLTRPGRHSFADVTSDRCQRCCRSRAEMRSEPRYLTPGARPPILTPNR